MSSPLSMSPRAPGSRQSPRTTAFPRRMEGAWRNARDVFSLPKPPSTTEGSTRRRPNTVRPIPRILQVLPDLPKLPVPAEIQRRVGCRPEPQSRGSTTTGDASGSSISLPPPATPPSRRTFRPGTSQLSVHSNDVEAIVDPMHAGPNSLGTLVALLAPEMLAQVPLHQRGITVPRRVLDRAIRRNKSTNLKSGLRSIHIAQEKERGFIEEDCAKHMAALVAASNRGVVRIAKREARFAFVRTVVLERTQLWQTALADAQRLLEWEASQRVCWSERALEVATMTRERAVIHRSFKSALRLTGTQLIQKLFRQHVARKAVRERRDAVQKYIDDGWPDANCVITASQGATPQMSPRTPGGLTPAAGPLSPPHGLNPLQC